MREDETADLISHLSELRSRLLRIVLYLLVGLAVGWAAFPWIFDLLMLPVKSVLEEHQGRLQYLDMQEPFWIRWQVSFYAGVILALPGALWEIWRFVAPGLTRKERRALRPILPLSGLLCLLGIALGYFITPAMLRWFAGLGRPEVAFQAAVLRQAVFLAKFYLAFGLAFQLPLVVAALARVGIVSTPTLLRRWREAVLLISVAAAIITPSWDPFSMLACALPMVVLYLTTILFLWRADRRRRKEEAAEGELSLPEAEGGSLS
jgi:sec-independent protein translocase protein TatC